MLLSYATVDFHLFYDGAADMQIWTSGMILRWPLRPLSLLCSTSAITKEQYLLVFFTYIFKFCNLKKCITVPSNWGWKSSQFPITKGDVEKFPIAFTFGSQETLKTNSIAIKTSQRKKSLKFEITVNLKENINFVLNSFPNFSNMLIIFLIHWTPFPAIASPAE